MSPIGKEVRNNIRDVIHEDAIKISGATKAPDYCFRFGGVRKFFLETKKPSIDGLYGLTEKEIQIVDERKERGRP